MFTRASRQRCLDELIEHAHLEPAVSAAAVVGSRAARRTDEWSDIDLALRLDAATDLREAADAWAAHLRMHHDVVDQLDIWSGSALFRVFLLSDSLQIDLSFWPAGDFASTGEPFDLVFGDVDTQPSTEALDRRSDIGWAWLYALHTRSAIARGRRWQALQMLEGLRNRIVTLACVRTGVPGHQGRGVDQLPGPFLAALELTLVLRLEREALAASFRNAMVLLLEEAAQVDRALSQRLRAPLRELAESVCGVGIP